MQGSNKTPTPCGVMLAGGEYIKIVWQIGVVVTVVAARGVVMVVAARGAAVVTARIVVVARVCRRVVAVSMPFVPTVAVARD